MVIKLDERKSFRGPIVTPALAKNFCSTNADVQSVCGS